MKKIFRIGTRESPLALWQAHKVATLLKQRGCPTQIIPITSAGDVELHLPLYEMGITGIFTKTLDLALLQNRIDLAVHSLKDVPTRLPEGLKLAGVLERADFADVLLYKDGQDFNKNKTAIIATGSLRRKAQWLYRYPHHELVNLRGNVNTRLQKLADHPWQGAIFAKAGLERIALLPETYEVLDWMLPAPAQGVVGIATRENDVETNMAVEQINDTKTFLAARVERDFLNALEGGCTAPIGALAIIGDKQIEFKGAVFEVDGSAMAAHQQTFPLTRSETAGREAACTIKTKGGDNIMDNIRKQLPKKQ